MFLISRSPNDIAIFLIIGQLTEAEWRIYASVKKITIISSVNGLSPGRRQDII